MCGVTLMNNQIGAVVADVMASKPGVTVTPLPSMIRVDAVGRTAAANTDAYLSAEILTWSRTKGVFAGIALNGATLRPDLDGNSELYGKRMSSQDILMTHTQPPAAAHELIAELDKYSGRKEGAHAEGTL